LPTDKQDKQPRKEQIKVTDKRIFTPEGEIREEFRDEIHPSAPQAEPPRVAAAPAPEAPPAAVPEPEKPAAAPKNERRRTLAETGENPGTPFTDVVEMFVAQGYIALGLLRNPTAPETRIDVAAARRMIDILSVLQEKTAGNLTPEEEDFLSMHLGELKLAYVQRTKKI